MTDQRAHDRAAPHTHPSAFEILAADYPGWEINRTRAGTRYGPWQANRDEVTLTSESPAGLLVRLEAQELARLQAEHSTRWKVWRTPRYWMATALVDGVEPTLMEETPAALEARMVNPGTWAQQRRAGGAR